MPFFIGYLLLYIHYLSHQLIVFFFYSGLSMNIHFCGHQLLTDAPAAGFLFVFSAASFLGLPFWLNVKLSCKRMSAFVYITWWTKIELKYFDLYLSELEFLTICQTAEERQTLETDALTLQRKTRRAFWIF